MTQPKLLIILPLLIVLCHPNPIPTPFSSPTPITLPLTHYPTPHPTHLGLCPPNDLPMVYAAIAPCEQSDFDNTTVCISTYIKKNYSQSWNVFMKNNAENPDVTSFWYLNNCTIELKDYGKFARYFLLWPANDYSKPSSFVGRRSGQNPNDKNGKNQELKQFNRKMHQKQAKQSMNPQQDESNNNHLTTAIQPLFTSHPQLPGFHVTASCPTWKLLTVKSILTYCDILGNDNAAQCIVNKIKDFLTENWDAYVSTTATSSSNNWYIECAGYIDSFGQFSRHYQFWRTYL